MKNLFVLMALAGVAAFQAGCGDSAPAPAAKPPVMTGPPGGAMPGMPGMPGGPAGMGGDKMTHEDKAKDYAKDGAVVADDANPDEAAGSTEEKTDEDAPKE